MDEESQADFEEMYVRGSRADYDGWESMGNKGWGWEGIAPYFRKHQCYDANGDVHLDPQFMPYAAKDNHHGTDGPVHTSFNDYYEVGSTVWQDFDSYADSSLAFRVRLLQSSLRSGRQAQYSC